MSTTFIYMTTIDNCVKVLIERNKNPHLENDILSWEEDSRPHDGGNNKYAVGVRKVNDLLYMDKGCTPYWNGQAQLSDYLDQLDSTLYLSFRDM